MKHLHCKIKSEKVVGQMLGTKSFVQLKANIAYSVEARYARKDGSVHVQIAADHLQRGQPVFVLESEINYLGTALNEGQPCQEITDAKV